MRPASFLWHVATGLGVVALSGCLGPTYNPYGRGAYPGYMNYSYPGYGYPGTFQTQTPGGTYVPGATINSSPQPTPTYGGSGTDAAPWGGGSNVPVPNPQDPSPYFENSGTMYVPQPGEEFRSPAGGNSLLEPGGDRISAADVSGPVRQPALGGVSNRDPEVQAVGWSTEAPSRDPLAAAATGTDYTSLQGVVDFDPADRTWSIVYDETPAPDDRFAGQLTLGDSPLLQTLRSGERVRLEGDVDSTRPDRFGKPTYQAVRIIRDRA